MIEGWLILFLSTPDGYYLYCTVLDLSHLSRVGARKAESISTVVGINISFKP